MFSYVMVGPFILASFFGIDAEEAVPPQVDVVAASDATPATAPRSHQPVALLRVSAQAPTLLASASRASTGNENFNTFKNTQASLLKSNFVLQAALRNPKLKALPIIQKHRDDIVDWIQQYMTVDYPGDAEIMRIRFARGTPQEQAEIVNSVAETYITEIVNSERQDAARTHDLLDKNLKKANDELRKKSEALYTLRRDLNQDEISEVSKQLLMKRLDALSDRRIKLENQLFELKLEADLIALKRKSDQEEQAIAATPELKQKLEARLAAIDKASASTTPEQELYQHKLAELDRSIQEIVDQLSKRGSYSAEVGMRERELSGLSEHVKNLEEQVRLRSINLGALPRIVIIESATAN